MHAPDAEALLAGICADVDADLPRLVFADYLEETGHPANVARAAYIRLQIEDDEVEGDHPERAANRAKLEQLKTQFRDEWDVAWNGRACPVRYERRRGFVDTIRADAGDVQLIDYDEEVWALLPVTRVDVLIRPEQFHSTAAMRPAPEFWARFWNEPTCGRLREVVLSERMSLTREVDFNDYLTTVLRSPTLTGLRKLVVSLTRLDDLGVISLLSQLRFAEFFETLEILDLSHNQLTDQAAHALAAADWPPNFKLLLLGGNRLTPQGLDIVQARFRRDGKRTARVV